MSDPYPSTLNVEIDRLRLKRYLRAKWLLSWTLPLCFFGGMFGLTTLGRAVDGGLPSWVEGATFVAKGVSIGVGVSLMLGFLCYLAFSHRLAARLAASIEVSVEGSFLRIRQHTNLLTDRKLHFRSIVDYATTQDSLMRHFGIHALQMTTTAGGPSSTIIIPAVKDCLKIRDVLSDIDRRRENQ